MLPRRRSPRLLAITLLIGYAISVTSCGKDQPDLLAVYPVRGQVLVGGQPAENAEVFFFLIGNNNARTGASQAIVDKDGWYTLSTYKDKDGAPEGKFVVTVVWPDGPRPPDEGYQAARMRKPIDRLGGKYANSDESSLRRTVPQGGGVVEAINLNLPPSAPGESK